MFAFQWKILLIYRIKIPNSISHEKTIMLIPISSWRLKHTTKLEIPLNFGIKVQILSTYLIHLFSFNITIFKYSVNCQHWNKVVFHFSIVQCFVTTKVHVTVVHKIFIIYVNILKTFYLKIYFLKTGTVSEAILSG